MAGYVWAPEAQNTVKTWADVRTGFPKEEIHLFGAGVDSGTYDYFTPDEFRGGEWDRPESFDSLPLSHVVEHMNREERLGRQDEGEEPERSHESAGMMIDRRGLQSVHRAVPRKSECSSSATS